MLVARKQDWRVHEEQSAQVSAKPTPAINNNLRKKCLLLISVMVLIAMAITVQREMIVRSGYDLVSLKSQSAVIQKENELLRLEIAKLKTQHRIKEIAKGQLGMVEPQTMLYASLPNTKSNNHMTAAGSEKTASEKLLSVVKAGVAEANKGR